MLEYDFKSQKYKKREAIWSGEHWQNHVTFGYIFIEDPGISCIKKQRRIGSNMYNLLHVRYALIKMFLKQQIILTLRSYSIHRENILFVYYDLI